MVPRSKLEQRKGDRRAAGGEQSGTVFQQRGCLSRGLNEDGEGVLGEGVPGRGKSQGESPEAGMC